MQEANVNVVQILHVESNDNEWDRRVEGKEGADSALLPVIFKLLMN